MKRYVAAADHELQCVSSVLRFRKEIFVDGIRKVARPEIEESCMPDHFKHVQRLSASRIYRYSDDFGTARCVGAKYSDVSFTGPRTRGPVGGIRRPDLCLRTKTLDRRVSG